MVFPIRNEKNFSFIIVWFNWFNLQPGSRSGHPGHSRSDGLQPHPWEADGLACIDSPIMLVDIVLHPFNMLSEIKATFFVGKLRTAEEYAVGSVIVVHLEFPGYCRGYRNSTAITIHSRSV